MVDALSGRGKGEEGCESRGATFLAGGGAGPADGFGYMADSAAAAEDGTNMVTGNPIRRRESVWLVFRCRKTLFRAFGCHWSVVGCTCLAI